ncbi:MAG: hypothetical protein K8L91_21995 [Anaerolineae bacterium]|nr:hypothetical protein [Anaerolineae bacterium]
MPKPVIIPKWAYFKPSKAAHRGLKKYLKYVAFRENPEHFELEEHEKWTDCGLGSNWREVYAKLTELKGPYILAHNMLISPAPDLMELVPDDLKHELVREVTERTIETWHIQRGLTVPEYSFCLHDRDTTDYGLSQVHAHIFIAGTIENSLGERESHRVGKSQVVASPYALERQDNLHRIARDQMEQMLDRTIGVEWRELRPPDPEPASTEQPTLWDQLMADVTVDSPQAEQPQPQPPSILPTTPSLDLEL